MTSCCVRFSISWISGTEKCAFARISSASAEGMSPREAIASQARTSISSQMENFLSSAHISRISWREYLSITPRDYGTEAGSKAFFVGCGEASHRRVRRRRENTTAPRPSEAGYKNDNSEEYCLKILPWKYCLRDIALTNSSSDFATVVHQPDLA